MKDILNRIVDRLRVALATCFYLLVCVTVFAQNQELHQLQQRLPAIKDSLEYIDTWNRVGIVMHMKNADSSFYYGIQGKMMADRQQYIKGQADAINNIALSFYYNGLYSQALSLFGQALPLYEKIRDSSNIVQMLMNTGSVYYFLNDPTTQFAFYRKAMEIGGHMGNDSIMSLMYFNYAFSNTALNDDSVNLYLNKAAQIAVEYYDTRIILAIKLQQADRLLGQHKNSAALPIILKAMADAREAQFPGLEIQALFMYGTYYSGTKKYDSAIVCYQTAHQLAVGNGFSYAVPMSLQRLLEIYETKNDLQKQIEILKALRQVTEKEKGYLKNFIVDYTQYNSAQQSLINLGIENTNNKKTIVWLVVVCIIGIVTVIVMVRLYYLSKNYSRHLALLNQKVTSQYELLQQADEFKRRLISMLAHDFKSPLVSTIQTVGLLKTSSGLDKQQAAVFYNDIMADAENVLYTFDNMLEWIKKNYSGYVFSPQIFSLHYLVEESRSMHMVAMADKRLVFANHVAESVTVCSDKEIVQFITRNLIHNAIKFSPVGGAITINASLVKSETVVSVKDEGRGIAPAQLQELFTFSNSDLHTKTVDKGAGIALTICKEFITTLGGRIWVESELGQGATFYFALPQGKVQDL